MFDGLLHLQANSPLFRLLTHYAQMDSTGQRVWQDRLMELAGVDVAGLVKLHAQLITSEWIDLNLGSAAAKETRKVGGCYRASLAGIRALKLLEAGPGHGADMEETCGAPDPSTEDAGAPAKRKRQPRTSEVASPIIEASLPLAQDAVPDAA